MNISSVFDFPHYCMKGNTVCYLTTLRVDVYKVCQNTFCRGKCCLAILILVYSRISGKEFYRNVSYQKYSKVVCR